MSRRQHFFFLIFFLMMFSSGTSYAQFGKKDRKEKQKKEAAAPGADRKLNQRELELAEAYFVDGMKYFMLEDYANALAMFQESYAINPGNAAVNFKIAEIKHLTNQVASAMPYAKAALALDASNPYYYLLLAQLHSGQGNLEEAIRIFARLTRDVPNSEQYLFNLAELYIAQNRFDEAIRTYERLEKKYGKLEEVSFKKQQIYLKQNNLDKAIAEGQNLIESNPLDARYQLALAELYASNNRLAQALEQLEKALKVEPGLPQALLMRSDIFRQQGKTEAANQELKQAFSGSALDIDNKVMILVEFIRQLPNPAYQSLALSLADSTIKYHPQEAKAYAVTGDLQVISNKKKEARNNYLKAVKLDDSHFKIWQQIVLLDAELNDTDALVQHTEQALELFPNQNVLWFYNGTAYMLQKNYAKAVKALEMGKKLSAGNPELLAQFNIQLGDSYHSLKEYAKSEAAYDAVLAYDSNNAHVLNNYSYFLSLRNENLEKAKQMADRLMRQEPQNATYIDTYAWVLYKMKQYEEAHRYLEKIAPTATDGAILEHYGDVLFQIGKPEQALEQWIRAKQAGDTSELIDKKIKDRKLYE